MTSAREVVGHGLMMEMLDAAGPWSHFLLRLAEWIGGAEFGQYFLPNLQSSHRSTLEKESLKGTGSQQYLFLCFEVLFCMMETQLRHLVIPFYVSDPHALA